MNWSNLLVIFTSKKFWALIAGLLVLFLGERGGMSADAIANALNVIIAYIVGQGVADAGAFVAKAKK